MANKLSKYITVSTILIRNCFSKETAYHLPFLMWIFVNIIWFGFSFFSIDLLFQQVPNIAGWTLKEARILVTVHGLFLTLIWIFIMPNLIVFWRLINQGTLDFHLLKPLSARFLASATNFEFDMIPRLIPILIIFYFFIFPTINVSSSQWVYFILSLLLGIIIFYNFGFMVVTTCFWFVKIDSIQDFFNSSMDIGKYPADVFKNTPKLIFSYLIPTIFIAYYPTMILLGKNNWNIFLISFAAALLSSLISQWFWNFALKRYSSASS